MTQIISGDTITPSMSERRKGSAIVIGGGFGGLATAIRLQAAGHAVTLVEARDRLGGRAYQLKKDGFTFDMGPSLITAPHLLDDLWRAAGRSLEEDVTLLPLSPFYRIYFHDGRYFDYWGTPAEDEAEIAKFELRDVQGYRSFLADTQRIYERAFADLADQPFLTLNGFLGVVPELMRYSAQRSVYTYVSRYFRNPPLAKFGLAAHSFLSLGGRPALGQCGIPEGGQAPINLFAQLQGIGLLIEGLQSLLLLWTQHSCG